MSKPDKKKFKDTKAFQWMKENGVNVVGEGLDIVDDFYPPVKLLTNIVKKSNPMLTEVDIDQFAQEAEKERTDWLADVSNAREMYVAKNEMADKVAVSVMQNNLWIIASLIVINVLLIIFVSEKAITGMIGTLIGTVIGSLLQERNQVVGFFFGSSLGSKLKDFFNRT